MSGRLIGDFEISLELDATMEVEMRQCCSFCQSIKLNHDH